MGCVMWFANGVDGVWCVRGWGYIGNVWVRGWGYMGNGG